MITITDVDPLTSDDSFKIIRTQSDRFVAQLKVAISAEVLVRFEYYADGRLSRHVGGSQESMNTEFLADVLVTIRGDSVDDCAIHYVEVADADVHLDFGDIVPDDSEYEE